MTATTVALCVCGHAMRMHERAPGGAVDDREACTSRGCVCSSFRTEDSAAGVTPPAPAVDPADPPVRTKKCTKCHEVKPRTEFYATGEGNKVNGSCRDCDNARPRTRSAARIIRVRARHRAVAELIRRHDREFRGLIEDETARAQREAEQLATTVAAADAYQPGQTVRLRAGQRRPGQTSQDRIDVARCVECVGYHDRGHACAICGRAPHGESVAS